MKLLEVQSTKEFASTFLNDIFFRMAVNRVLDAAPAFELVRCMECKHVKFDRYHGEYMCEHSYGGMVNVNARDFCSYGERKRDGQA